MQDHRRNSGWFVTPGEQLGVIEEFIPDSGTYVKDGVIYSRVVGRALADFLNKKVSVSPLVHGIRTPTVGSLVVGQVSSIQPQSATIRIFKIGRLVLSGFFTGYLHVSDVQPGFVDSMSDACKPGDILRAKVISEKNRVYHLSTRDRNLGVVYAFCSDCGAMLEQRGRGLRCLRCGKVERRKAAIDYGKGII